MRITYLEDATTGLERLLVNSLSLVPHLRRFIGYPFEALFLFPNKEMARDVFE